MVRLLSHSSSDDHRKYRSSKALDEDRNRDPITILENQCTKAKFISSKEFEKIENKIDAQVNRDADWAEAQDHPDAVTA